MQLKADIDNNNSGIILSLSKTEKLTHLMSWVGFLIVMLISSTIDDNRPIGLVISINLALELLYVAFFYLLIFHIYPFWYTNKFLFYLRAFIAIAFFNFLLFGFDYWLEPWSGFDTNVSFLDSMVGAVLTAFILIMYQ